ncbi:hypothetical protein Rleg9DRAFT_1413 [Rhizobium leguminosarum bv. trifolii WSM597]|uniref:Uncharacterized protein n=1 Tax=Rhizobium leguminosarum bv. trifolii WSM597 TaxID=754764 RepID=I9N3Z2_RHILT|nr:hypothetical protein Rleg9DRAFT_1413 [Rhizobium leguminosarum bv. trifolii WSM597]
MPTEPQKITGISIIPTTKIFVTAKLRNAINAAKSITVTVSCYGHEVRDRSDFGLSFGRSLHRQIAIDRLRELPKSERAGPTESVQPRDETLLLRVAFKD